MTLDKITAKLIDCQKTAATAAEICSFKKIKRKQTEREFFIFSLITEMLFFD